MLLFSVLRGMVSTLSVASSELYRYPYRNAAESFRGDWKRIGGDIEQSLQQLDDDEYEA
jgi:hypothetical protein